MKTNAELEALSNDSEPRIAASACVGLARRYGVGLFGTEPNQLTALDWATKAATLGSPNGYYQYAQIAGSASLSFDDPENKAYFASLVIQACDLGSGLTKFIGCYLPQTLKGQEKTRGRCGTSPSGFDAAFQRLG